MPPNEKESSELRVVISTDRLSAELEIPSQFDRAMLSKELIGGTLQQAGAEVTEANEKLIEACLAAIEDSPVEEEKETLTAIVARGTPPEHGEDGRVDWAIDQEHEQKIDETQSYYNHSAFITVVPGQILGRIYQPLVGKDGRDVTGKTLAARDGKTIRLVFDETILENAQGELIAQQEGLLVRNQDHANIQQVLEVNEAVDFSTGNIEFPGSVNVRQGVKDCFIIKAGGNIEIHGLVEAAILHADGDLLVAGGFAGRDQGNAYVGGNLRGKYLDGVDAEVRGDLMIDREVINSRLTVHGGVQMPRGSIIGGQAIITGSMVIGNLGSGGNVATDIAIGSVPRLEPMYEQLREMTERLASKVHDFQQEQDTITKMSTKGRMTATDKERQTEIMFELSTLQQSHDRAVTAVEAVEKKLDELCVVDVQVERILYPGVVFHCGELSYRITDEHRGPIRIKLDKSNVLTYQTSASQNPNLLAEISEPCSRAAA